MPKEEKIIFRMLVFDKPGYTYEQIVEINTAIDQAFQRGLMLGKLDGIKWANENPKESSKKPSKTP